MVHCNDLETLPVGWLVKRLYKAKLVYDAHEYEIEEGTQGRLRLLTEKFLEKNLIRKADRVLTVSESIANEYARIYQISKPDLVLNCPAFTEVKQKQNLFRDKFQISDDQPVFLYQGGFSPERGITIILETFKNVWEEQAVHPVPVVIFMGFGVLENQIREYTEKYPNIFLHPAVSPNELLQYTSSSDFGILFYENTCLNHYYCSPNKMFEYLMAELPVIISDLYEMKRIVNEYGVGVAAHENSVAGLQKAICDVMEKGPLSFKSNIRDAKNIYNWENQEKVLLHAYQAVLDNENVELGAQKAQED
jgi:glycosyltransferase involved in cell wall biosynthesis